MASKVHGPAYLAIEGIQHGSHHHMDAYSSYAVNFLRINFHWCVMYYSKPFGCEYTSITV